MKVTANTITDAQIRELRDATYGSDDPNEYRVTRDCNLASLNLSIGYAPKHERDAITRAHRDARTRCADAWNARHGGES